MSLCWRSQASDSWQAEKSAQKSELVSVEPLVLVEEPESHAAVGPHMTVDLLHLVDLGQKLPDARLPCYFAEGSEVADLWVADSKGGALPAAETAEVARCSAYHPARGDLASQTIPVDGSCWMLIDLERVVHRTHLAAIHYYPGGDRTDLASQTIPIDGSCWMLIDLEGSFDHTHPAVAVIVDRPGNDHFRLGVEPEDADVHIHPVAPVDAGAQSGSDRIHCRLDLQDVVVRTFFFFFDRPPVGDLGSWVVRDMGLPEKAHNGHVFFVRVRSRDHTREPGHPGRRPTQTKQTAPRGGNACPSPAALNPRHHSHPSRTSSRFIASEPSRSPGGTVCHQMTPVTKTRMRAPIIVY